MSRPKRMLVENLAWAAETAQADPDFFAALAQGQRPRVLWIGCSDSRVPAETITNADPGTLFVHRNIANLFAPDDDNVMSVLEYAVHALKVEDIVFCGHYGCGGVRASLQPPPENMPHLVRRIAPLRALACRHGALLDALPDETRRADRLAELNVLEQVRAVRLAAVVRDADPAPRVHGWIFDLRDGRIQVLDAGHADPSSLAPRDAVPAT